MNYSEMQIQKIEYLQNVIFEGAPKRVYSLRMKMGRTNKGFFRFFVVDSENKINDITRYVHYITEYPMRDCGDYWAIYTHSTNAQDIVMLLSEAMRYPLEWERI